MGASMAWAAEVNMAAVPKFFLRAKHWQIFLLFFGLYVAGTIAMLFDLATARSQEELVGISLPFVFVMVLCMLCVVAWLWSMGSFLNSIGEPTLRLRVSFFRFALLYPTVYIPIFFALFNTSRPALLALIFPLHFFAMFCLFYDLYFVSKSLALVETGKLVSFYDYAGAFFLLWFFPLGVWFIQPRINRLYVERSGTGAITSRMKPNPGEMVVLTAVPPGMLDDLPEEDQLAIKEIVGKLVLLNEYDDAGRAELEFKDRDGNPHYLFVAPEFIKSTY